MKGPWRDAIDQVLEILDMRGAYYDWLRESPGGAFCFPFRTWIICAGAEKAPLRRGDLFTVLAADYLRSGRK